MNAPAAPALLKISTVNVSADGTRLTPGDGQVNLPLTEGAALAALRAFAGLPTMELVHADAKIYLAGPCGKLAVQNNRGKLFAAYLPETTNIAAELTPEQIIATLTVRDSAAAAAVAVEAVVDAEVVRPAGGWRRGLNSGWTVAALALVAAVLAYVNFAPAALADVDIIRDPTKVSRLHLEFNGRYGAPNATTLVLAGGRLTGEDTSAPSGAGAPLFEKTYRFALSGDRVVLVVDNGALLEPQPDGSLKFLESTYPRHGR
jgi:hypothetical protein